MRGLVLVNGGRIRCTDSGGDGPAVVLLHGDWTDSALWAPLIPLLRDDFRVIGYDELAHGGSPPPTAAYTRRPPDGGRPRAGSPGSPAPSSAGRSTPGIRPACSAWTTRRCMSGLTR
jgi:pimeloyl-ACP methyl ester carboxylesterase